MNLDLVELFKRDNSVHYIQIPLDKVFMFGSIDNISLIAVFDEKTIIDLFHIKKTTSDLFDKFNKGFN